MPYETPTYLPVNHPDLPDPAFRGIVNLSPMPTLIELTPDQLRQIIVEAVKEVMITQKDHLITRKEAAEMLRCSVQKVAQMERRGQIKRVNPTGWPKYSYLQTLKFLSP